MKMNNLFNYFPKFATTDSLFGKMISLGAPWSASQGLSMDTSYFTMWAGVGIPSTFVRMNSTDGIADSTSISKILWDIYGQNWIKLWNGFMKEYNPIENYNLSETVTRSQTDDRTIDKSGSLDSKVNGTETSNVKEIFNGDVEQNGSDNENSTENLDGSVTVTGTTSVVEDSTGTSALEHGEIITKNAEANSFVFGFNDTVKVPTGVEIETGTDNHTGTDTTTTTAHTTTDTTISNTTKTDNDTTGTLSKTTKLTTDTNNTTTTDLNGTSEDVRKDSTSENTVDKDSINENITRNRSGNVGQNSYQELLKQEFELWKWNFFKQVFSDVDEFLILKVYDTCQFSQL